MNDYYYDQKVHTKLIFKISLIIFSFEMIFYKKILQSIIYFIYLNQVYKYIHVSSLIRKYILSSKYLKSFK